MRILRLFLIGLSFSAVVGCTKGMRVRQIVEFRLTRPSGQPAENAVVDMAPLTRYYRRQADLTNKEWAAKHYWKPSKASSAGIAILDLVHFQGMHPLALVARPRPFVDCHSFHVFIADGACEEDLDIHYMEPGRKVFGECVDVEVISIEPPHSAK